MGLIGAVISRVFAVLFPAGSKDDQRKIEIPDYLLAIFLSTYVITRVLPMPTLLANLIAAAAGLLCFAFSVFLRPKVPLGSCLLIGALFSLSMLVSMIYNHNSSFYHILWVWAFLGVAMLLYACRLNTRFILAQFYIFALVLALCAIFGLPAKDFLAIGSENNISTYLILYLLVYLLSRRHTPARIPYAPIAVALTLTMWTGSRGGLLALLVLLGLAAVYNHFRFPRKRKLPALWAKIKQNRLLLAASAVVVLVLVVWVLTGEFFRPIISKLVNYGGSSVRTQIWADYFRAATENAGNLLLGPNITDSAYEWLARYPGNPHNAFLTLHSRFGLPGFCVMAVGIVWVLLYACRRKKYILAIVLIAASARSFFDWTAFPGPYDTFYYFSLVYWLGSYPILGSTGRRKPPEHTGPDAGQKDIGGFAMNLYETAKKVYNKLATLFYNMTSRKKMVDIRTLYDTENMSRYHHIVSALRFVAVEEYYGQNDFGKNLYINANTWKDDTALEEDLAKFDALIKSIETNGYNNKYAIYVDLDGNCINGTHRLALCAWFGIKQIPVITIRRHLKVPTVQQQAKKYRLSPEDAARLELAYQKMRANLQ